MISELEMLTLNEIAKILKISRQTAYKVCLQWDIKTIRFGKSIRVLKSDFVEAVKKNSHTY